MPIVPEVFEPVFATLVGDEAQVAAFQGSVAERIHGSPDEDPYDALYRGTISQINNALYEAGINTADRKDIYPNERLAMQLTGGVLRAVGDIYEERASAPQAVSNVQRNTNRGLLHLHTMAFDGKVSYANEAAYFHGSNPRNPFSQAVARFIFARQIAADRIRMNARTFVVTEDEAGQLDMHRQHKMIAPDGMARCPVADVKVGTADTQRSALLVMMKAMGGVAVSEIFARRFPIIDDTATLRQEKPLVTV